VILVVLQKEGIEKSSTERHAKINIPYKVWNSLSSLSHSQSKVVLDELQFQNLALFYFQES
jgi:hypothetical protein